ncbi:MAG TPA: NUDIX domain-containing protein, partial [Candidatus Aenigmarchaeota archaeon]|nr:NUDIX domain-containing protein [Candidatus Aenigmarchaeota archaeon]
MKLLTKCKFGVCPKDNIVERKLRRVGFSISRNNPDLIVVIGGDGTFTKIAQKSEVPLIFIRDKVSVGALAEFSISEIDEVVKSLNEGNYRIEKMMRIEVNGKKAFSDIYITHKTGAESIEYEIEGKHFYDIRISSGVIFSTPQGTTGYTRSAGGPVVKKERIVITHICPYEKVKLRGKVIKAPYQRWYIIGPDEKVRFRLLWPEKAALHIDGKRVGFLNRLETLEVKKDGYAKILRFGKKVNYVDTVDCVVEKDGKILLIKRKFKPFKGKLALPGGKVEEGESAKEAARRELEEETGLKALSLIEFGHFWGFERDPRGPTYDVAFLVHAKGKVKPGIEALNVGWYKVKDLKPSQLAFDHWKILYDYFRW